MRLPKEEKTHRGLVEVSFALLAFRRDGFRVGVQTVGLVAKKRFLVGFIEVIELRYKAKNYKNIYQQNRWEYFQACNQNVVGSWEKKKSCKKNMVKHVFTRDEG